MACLDEVPDHILHDIISFVIDSTRYIGWKLSLRLINRQFNEVVLYEYFFRHTYRTIPVVDRALERGGSHGSHRWLHDITYPMQFLIQSLLTLNTPSSDTQLPPRLRQNWRAARNILRGDQSFERSFSEQASHYLTCSNNSTFNDAASIVLSRAVNSYLGMYIFSGIIEDGNQDRVAAYGILPPEFWVMLSSCVLGDLHLFKTYASRLTLLLEQNALPEKLEYDVISYHPAALLTVAIKHSRLGLVKYILEQYPSFTSIGVIYSLRAAIQSENEDILRAVLLYTPPSSSFLIDGLSGPGNVTTKPDVALKMIRLLSERFCHFSPEACTTLILQNYRRGNLILLQAFLQSKLFRYNWVNGAKIFGPAYARIAIYCGNTDVLRSLLDNSAMCLGSEVIKSVISAALSWDRIECYRELYQRFPSCRLTIHFEKLCSVNHAEDDVDEFMCTARSALFETAEAQQPSNVQRGLYNAIQNLQSGNVRILLRAGAWLFPWYKPCLDRPHNMKNPFMIKWPVFNRDQDAFLRTQAVLDAYDLPQLKLVV